MAPLHGKERLLLPTGALVQRLLEERLAGGNTDQLAYVFHRDLAAMIAGACLAVREETGLTTAALSGGVFQNRLLLHLCDQTLQQLGFTVLKHSTVPPNDGGIALGQAVYAAYM